MRNQIFQKPHASMQVTVNPMAPGGGAGPGAVMASRPSEQPQPALALGSF